MLTMLGCPLLAARTGAVRGKDPEILISKGPDDDDLAIKPLLPHRQAFG
jgi:hypothetical protein